MSGPVPGTLATLLLPFCSIHSCDSFHFCSSAGIWLAARACRSSSAACRTAAQNGDQGPLRLAEFPAVLGGFGMGLFLCADRVEQRIEIFF